MKHKHLHAESAEEELSILGDFGFNPVATVDGYGTSFPITSKKQVEKEALKVNMYSNTVTPPVQQQVKQVAPSIAMEVDDTMKVKAAKPVLKTTKPVVSVSVPMWSTALLYAGVPAGLAVGFYRKSGVTGLLISGLVGGVICALPSLYFHKKAKG